MAKLDQLFTAQEIDDCLEEFVFGQLKDDPESVERDMDRMIEIMAKSKRCATAFETAIEHIRQQGPGHIGCGIKQTGAAFFLIGLKLAEKRLREQGAIDELERLMRLGEAQ